jgi:hypothetical protein
VIKKKIDLVAAIAIAIPGLIQRFGSDRNVLISALLEALIE